MHPDQKFFAGNYYVIPEDLHLVGGVLNQLLRLVKSDRRFRAVIRVDETIAQGVMTADQAVAWVSRQENQRGQSGGTETVKIEAVYGEGW